MHTVFIFIFINLSNHSLPCCFASLMCSPQTCQVCMRLFFFLSLFLYLFISASVCLTHWFCNPTVIYQNYSQGWRAKQSSLLTATHSKGQNSPCPLTPTHSHTFEHQSTYRGPPPSLCTQMKGFKLLESGQVSHANPTCGFPVY